MGSTIRSGTHTYMIDVEKLEVTSLSRTDTNWVQVDRCGHVHMYFPPDKPYNPSQRYTLPTLVAVHECAFWDDGEPYTRTHYECAICRERVHPGTTSDEYRQYIPLKTFSVDGAVVSEYEFYDAIAGDIGLPPEYRSYAWFRLPDLKPKEQG